MESGKGTDYFIYFAAITINIICFSTGTAYSWTSPLIPKFQSNDSNVNPIGTPLTLSESGLLVSLINLGLLVGPFLSSLVVNKMGKKMTILYSSVPLVAAHVMCAIATSLNEFLVARFLMGLTSGAVWTVIPGYLAEISEPRNRGLLNSLMLCASSCGCLFAYLTGPFVSVKWFSIINITPPMVFLLLLWIFIPNSPYDYMMTGNTNAAKESLVKLKQTSEVQKYLLEIETILSENSKSNAKVADILKNKGSCKALVICGTIMVFNAFAGTLIVLGYTQSIFDMAGTTMDSAYSAIMVGSIAFSATIVSCWLVDRLGRRPIIILSSIVTCASHAALGTFFHLQSSNVDLHPITWLPICSVISFMFAFNFGLGSLPYVILGEIFEPKIKAIASTICTTINFSLSFLITLVYPYLIESVGIANTFLFFALMLAGCAVYCAWQLPETKGKTFQEIYVLLSNGNKY